MGLWRVPEKVLLPAEAGGIGTFEFNGRLADGDQVMVNWFLTAPYVGTKEVVGGTGKYLGITGKGTFAGTPLKASVHGMDLFVTDVTLDFNFSHTQ